MAYIDVVEDENENILAELVTTHDKYALPGDVLTFITTTAAWCPSCEQFTLAETLLSAEEMKETARRFAERRPAEPQAEEWADRYLIERWLVATLWQEVLSRRQSPARCLECGGHDFVPLQWIRRWVDHPACPGKRVRVTPTVHARMARDGRLYDTEGRRIST
jgi:hypothetical protein